MAAPRTLMGQFIRATVRRDQERREHARARLAETGWVDSAAVIEGVFVLAVRRRFRPGQDVREIAAWVRQARQFFGPDTLPPRETEALIREELGDEVSTEDIPGAMIGAIKLLVFGGVVADLRLSDEELDDMLDEAERLAGEWGYHPTVG